MKRGLKVQLNFTNRFVYTFIALTTLLIVGVGVFAVGTSDPATFGHTAGEIDLSDGVANNVGIGISSPIAKLRIESSLGTIFQRFSAGTEIYQIGINMGGGSALNFQTDSGTNLLSLGKNGNVGIGTTSPQSTLDVAGSVKISFDSRTCDATITGSMRYNSGLNTIEFCDSFDWIPIGELGQSTGGGPDFDYTGPLIGGKTGAQCTSEGGVPFIIGSEGHLCQFAGSSCPSNWAQHNQWQSTDSNVCSTCASSCTALGQVFSDSPVESCTFTNGNVLCTGGTQWTPCRNTCVPGGTGTCTATTTNVGCK